MALKGFKGSVGNGCWGLPTGRLSHGWKIFKKHRGLRGVGGNTSNEDLDRRSSENSYLSVPVLTNLWGSALAEARSVSPSHADLGMN